MSRDGKKTGGRDFKKGNPGGPGPPRIPLDLKEARKVNQLELSRVFNKTLFMNHQEITEVLKKRDLPMLELVAARVVSEAFNEGDQRRLEYIIDRLIGKAPMSSEVAAPRVRTFPEFCEKAGYFIPFPKQEEMRSFAMELDDTRLLLGARGYGKTDFVTIMGTAFDIYKAFCEGHDLDLYTTLIITKSKPRNGAIIGEIASALEANGVPLEKSNASTIRVKGLIGQDHSVEAITIKSSMRGRHPKRIVMDDPVTDEDVSEAMRDLVKRRYDEAYKLTKNIVIIGQPAHHADLYALLRDVVKTMLVPHGSIRELDVDLDAMLAAQIDAASISMSYRLIVPREGQAIFSDIKSIDDFPEGQSMAFLDPSDGGDYTALSIFRGYMQGVAVQGHAIKKAWYHAIDQLVEIMKVRGVKVLWFETNATGKQPLIQLKKLLDPLGIKVIGVVSSSNKHADILTAGSFSSVIHLSKKSDKVYTDQVMNYAANAKYDDAPDSLARGLIQLGLIKAKK